MIRARFESTYHLDDPVTDVYVGDCREILPQFPAERVALGLVSK